MKLLGKDRGEPGAIRGHDGGDALVIRSLQRRQEWMVLGAKWGKCECEEWENAEEEGVHRFRFVGMNCSVMHG